MKDNTCNYSDEWQPYIGDYDKYEYDVKLHDGTIVENCYPNARKFNSISDEHDGQSFSEHAVSEIRFSHNPRYRINDGVSEISQHKNEIVDPEVFPYYPFMQNIDKYVMHIPHDPKNRKAYPGGIRLKTVEPKIPRNQPCPCGSGKKYKKCCAK